MLLEVIIENEEIFITVVDCTSVVDEAIKSDYITICLEDVNEEPNYIVIVSNYPNIFVLVNYIYISIV